MTGILIYDTVMCILAFILGSVIGSFLNVVIYRTPAHMSIVNGPSHCFTCGERIKPYDLVPIFSWIFLGGKCRNCKAPISARYTFVEALTGFMFLAAYIRFSISWQLLIAIILFSVLIVLSFIDIDHLEIPYWCTITIALLGIPMLFIEPDFPWVEHLAGAAVIAVPFAVLALFGGMGGGDVQLMAAAGFLMGWEIIPSAIIGIVLGAIYGVISKAINSKRDKEMNEQIKAEFSEWVKDRMTADVSDIVVGEYEKGVCKINADIIEEKAWNNPEAFKDDCKELEARLTEIAKDMPENKEFVFRVTAKNGVVEKSKFQQRIAFGPALAVGIAIGVIFGERIISWYLGLM